MAYPMIDWVASFVSELKYPDMVKIIDLRALNPEPCYYYQWWHKTNYVGLQDD